MYQDFSRRISSQWTPVSILCLKIHNLLFFSLILAFRIRMMTSFLSFLYVTCHLQWSVYWERSLRQVVLLKVWGRPPKPLVDFSSAMEKSIKLSSHYLTELHLWLNEIAREADEVWWLTGYGKTTCSSFAGITSLKLHLVSCITIMSHCYRW